jgi:hypothetical protein
VYNTIPGPGTRFKISNQSAATKLINQHTEGETMPKWFLESVIHIFRKNDQEKIAAGAGGFREVKCPLRKTIPRKTITKELSNPI